MHYLKQYDDGIGIKATLSSSSDFSLDGATVVFYFLDHEITCQITNRETREVLAVLESIHTEKLGKHRGVFRVVFPDGRRETFPSNGYVDILIQKNIGGN